ncbi:MAG: hypothetical protein O3B41_00420 [Bacteroidetes bacterium]|nr:hypothetical protein [Bacteroidota bacterium]
MTKSIVALFQNASQVAVTDSAATGTVSTAYDSLWTGADIPTQAPSALEQVMLSDEKIFVVLAVVLIIWIGVILLILRTDRHLTRVERSVAENIPDADDGL